MKVVKLGKSGLVVPKNGFGALPIQRISDSDAVYLIQKALDHGLYYFDTARFYTDIMPLKSQFFMMTFATATSFFSAVSLIS